MRHSELLALALIALAAVAVWFLPPIGSSVVVVLGGAGAILLARRASHSRQTAAADAMRETVTSAIADPILIVREGAVLHANLAARHLLGNIVGQDVRSAIDHPGAADRIAARELGAPLELIGLANRRQRWLMRLTDYQGARYVHLTDATVAHAAEQMRVDFIANASHELRTPLATILGFVETLRDPEAGGDPKLRDRFLALVFEQATRMGQLVADLISLSRIEAEKTQAPTARLNLGIVARTVAQEARKLDEDAGTRGDISVDIASYFPLVLGDEALLKQLLHNLVANARRYGRPGTPVVIRIWQESADTVGLSVADEGEGIPAHHLSRLTERFYRADASRSRSSAGTGLGLSIVKHVVEHHRGRLNIASELGVGTTVSIYLPAVIEA